VKSHIHLTLARPNGRDSNAKISGKHVTPVMLDAAEDLLHALTTGERLLPKDLYDACANAFGTTRDDAKKRLTAAMYGAKAASEPTLNGWTWRAHLNELYADVREKRWLRASKALALMLRHALDRVQQEDSTP